jgi:hypothetical protein
LVVISPAMTTRPVAVKRFAGDAAGWNLVGEAGVEDGVGNLVGDFIGMDLRSRIRR